MTKRQNVEAAERETEAAALNVSLFVRGGDGDIAIKEEGLPLQGASSLFQ